MRMGLLETIRRNIRRSSRNMSNNMKNSLTIVATYNDTYIADENNKNSDNNQGELYTLFIQEPLSPHHGEITATSLPFMNKQRKKHFFEEDNNLPFFGTRVIAASPHDDRSTTTQKFSNNNGSNEEEERDDIRLLGSADSDTNRSFDFDKYQEETIFEPSFEVALMDPFSFSSLEDTLNAARQQSTEIFKDGSFPVPEHGTPPPRAQKRYDLYGRPFVHIFHDVLPTLYEDSEEDQKSKEGENDVGPDEARIRARWDLALEQMINADCSCEWDGIIPQRHGNRSSFEI